MNRKSGTSKASADRLVKTIRRKTRQTYSAEVSTAEQKPAMWRSKCWPLEGA